MSGGEIAWRGSPQKSLTGFLDIAHGLHSDPPRQFSIHLLRSRNSPFETKHSGFLQAQIREPRGPDFPAQSALAEYNRGRADRTAEKAGKNCSNDGEISCRLFDFETTGDIEINVLVPQIDPQTLLEHGCNQRQALRIHPRGQ